MLGIEYQKLAMVTNDGKSNERLSSRLSDSDLDYGQIVHAVMGLTGEAGEVSDLVKKHIFHEKELDIEHLAKELGDVIWYVALMCDAIGIDFDEIQQKNIDKLRNRYTEGKFNVYQANHRKEGDV